MRGTSKRWLTWKAASVYDPTSLVFSEGWKHSARQGREILFIKSLAAQLVCKLWLLLQWKPLGAEPCERLAWPEPFSMAVLGLLGAGFGHSITFHFHRTRYTCVRAPTFSCFLAVQLIQPSRNAGLGMEAASEMRAVGKKRRSYLVHSPSVHSATA